MAAAGAVPSCQQAVLVVAGTVGVLLVPELWWGPVPVAAWACELVELQAATVVVAVPVLLTLLQLRLGLHSEQGSVCVLCRHY